jgi:hypothetical protein
MNINLPTIKTVLKYIWIEEGQTTSVLTDFVEEDHEWYSDHATVQNNIPFEKLEDSQFECFLVGDGHYRLIEFEYGSGHLPEEKTVIDVVAIPVLEFKGKIFKLDETEYDLKDSEVGL